jgi:hypothetical protein
LTWNLAKGRPVPKARKMMNLLGSSEKQAGSPSALWTVCCELCSNNTVSYIICRRHLLKHPSSPAVAVNNAPASTLGRRSGPMGCVDDMQKTWREGQFKTLARRGGVLNVVLCIFLCIFMLSYVPLRVVPSCPLSAPNCICH